MVDEYTKKWLIKAMNDLKVMRNERNMKGDDLVTDAICFHAQQAAEKFLKAYLVAYDIEFGKTHNLKILLKQCADHDADFKKVTVGDLSDYAVEVRYPDEFYDPTIEEVDENISIAESIKEFILKKFNIDEKDLNNKQ